MDAPLRVLIVEDSEVDCALVVMTLKRAKYQLSYERVDTVQGLQDALENSVWDVIIADYTLPSMNALVTLEVVKKSGLDIPVIIVSGVIGEETAVAAMRKGAHDYLMKSNLNRLAPAIARERREAEARLAHKRDQEQIHKLSLALAQSASMNLIFDILGNIEYVNDAFTQISGYAARQVVGQDIRFFQSIFTLPDAEIIVQAWEHGVEWRGEAQGRQLNGDEYWVTASLVPIRQHDGSMSHLLWSAQDITVRKSLEAELRHYNQQLEEMVKKRTRELQSAKEQFEVILNASRDAIALAQPSGDIQRVNPAFNQLFGTRVDRALEQFLWTVEDEQQMESLAKNLLSVIYDGRDERVEASVLSADGNAVDADLALAPVNWADDDRSGVLVSLRDITQAKELERLKARFIANAAHDLSNPITSLKMRLYLLQRTPEKLDEHVQALESQINRLEQLVTELRMLSQIDQHTLYLDMIPVDLNGLLERIVATQQATAQHRNQRLVFSACEEPTRVQGDVQKLERIAINLVANAINYTPNGGTIRVRTWTTLDTVEFEVSDSGIGIEASHLPHIFERFYRTDRAKQTDTAGTGLGLSIVKELVSLHGGRVQVESQVDQGTTFRVTLPQFTD
jgi:PAS domain S-box-containing protein